MQNVKYTKSIPAEYEVDVFVAGGGPAGVAAAVSCAKLGKSVYLAEATGCFGGMGTNGLVPVFMSFADGKHFLVGDVGRKVRDGISDDRSNSSSCYHIDPERLKLVYDRIAEEAGIRFSLFTTLVDVIRQGERIDCAVLHSKRGFFAVKAKVFIDCTGDGDMAVLAGADFETGDEEGRTMPPTLCTLWANVDFERAGGMDEEKLEEAIKGGVFTYPDRHVPGMFSSDRQKGIATGNLGHCFGVNGTDERSLTQGMMLGRRQAREFERFYRDYMAGYENIHLCQTAPLLGVRETRRIVCDYRLTLDDFLNRASFADEIGRYSYPVDIHIMSPDKEAYEQYRKLFTNLKYGPGETYGIPYRSLIPRGLDNLLVAGRCIGSDRYMQSSIRVMPCCMLTGQAAGTAAALALEAGTTRGVDTGELRSVLRQHDVYLP